MKNESFVILTAVLLLIVAFPCMTTVFAVDFGNIMILGDSITQATAESSAATPLGGSYSYRYHLWRYMIDNDATFDFVGLMDNQYGTPGVNAYYPNYGGQSFDRDHEGHAAWTTEQVLNGNSNWQNYFQGTTGSGNLGSWLTGYTPDTALIMLGINDLAGDATSQTVADRLGTVIDTLQTGNPHVQIYLSTILPVQSNAAVNLKVVNTNALLPNLIASKSTASSTVLLVDTYTGFSTSSFTHDGVHPNSQGEYFIATKFASAMGLLTDLPSPHPGKNVGPLHVMNSSFEYPATDSYVTSMVGWTTENNSSGGGGILGVFNPAEGYLGVDGQNAGFFIYGDGAMACRQTLAGADGVAGSNDDPLLIANTRYSVSVAMGFRNADPWAGATVELLAGNQVVGSLVIAPDSPNAGSNRFVDYTFSLTTEESTAGLGEPLSVRIAKTGNVFNQYIDFDNVRVYAVDPARVLTKDYGQMYITNHSFEQAGGTSIVYGSLEGWEVDPGIKKCVGPYSVLRYSPGACYNDVTDLGALDGEYACYLSHHSGSPIGGIRQTLAGFDNVIGTEDDPILVANAEYSITVAAGLRNGSSYTPGQEMDKWTGMLIELLAGDQVIASKTCDSLDASSVNVGKFTDVNLSFVTDEDTIGLGELMTIRISCAKNGAEHYLDVDNVRMSIASVVPEPSSAILLTTSLSGLLACFWHTRKWNTHNNRISGISKN